MPDELKDLAKFLNDFDGIIIGHNILGYDYLVLEQFISLKRVINKSVDTLAFLYHKNGSRMGGLALDAVCQTNFRHGKTLKGKAIPLLWKQGEHAAVIRYNENDCKLTMRLWWHLVQKKPLCIGENIMKQMPARAIDIDCIPSSPPPDLIPADSEDIKCVLKQMFRNINFVHAPPSPDIISANDKDIILLVCKRPQLTHREWRRNIKTNGHAFKIKSVRPPYFEIIDPELKSGGKSIFLRFYCKPCEHRLFFVTDMHRNFSKQDIIKCPGCGADHPVLGREGDTHYPRHAQGCIWVLEKDEKGKLSFGVTDPPYNPERWVEPRKAREFIRRMR
jgi:hypothetical protein